MEFLDSLKKNDLFLDFVTGDLYEFTKAAGSWASIMNIGLHKKLIAEKLSII
jgi:hypothetical protein